MRLRPLDLVDVFVYLVVLGTFIQLFPAVISESFLLALLTAVLLKVVLEGVLWVKTRLLRGIRSPSGALARTIRIAALVLVLPGSKFLVLELVDLVFGDAVRLGGFFAVTALIIALMLARGGVRRLFARDGEADAAAGTDAGNEADPGAGAASGAGPARPSRPRP
ncbi:hypothetical protein ABXJ56_06430 [Microbacterium chocolatum]|uniref:hypothetical protein n=1 Tax=Microbacterium aurantiacum TaxID=162393 RepID=UPI00338EFCE9